MSIDTQIVSKITNLLKAVNGAVSYDKIPEAIASIDKYAESVDEPKKFLCAAAHAYLSVEGACKKQGGRFPEGMTEWEVLDKRFRKFISGNFEVAYMSTTIGTKKWHQLEEGNSLLNFHLGSHTGYLLWSVLDDVLKKKFGAEEGKKISATMAPLIMSLCNPGSLSSSSSHWLKANDLDGYYPQTCLIDAMKKYGIGFGKPIVGEVGAVGGSGFGYSVSYECRIAGMPMAEREIINYRELEEMDGIKKELVFLRDIEKIPDETLQQMQCDYFVSSRVFDGTAEGTANTFRGQFDLIAALVTLLKPRGKMFHVESGINFEQEHYDLLGIKRLPADVEPEYVLGALNRDSFLDRQGMAICARDAKEKVYVFEKTGNKRITCRDMFDYHTAHLPGRDNLDASEIITGIIMQYATDDDKRLRPEYLEKVQDLTRTYHSLHRELATKADIWLEKPGWRL